MMSCDIIIVDLFTFWLSGLTRLVYKKLSYLSLSLLSPLISLTLYFALYLAHCQLKAFPHVNYKISYDI